MASGGSGMETGSAGDLLPDTAPSRWEAGAVVAGRYRLDRVLGQGGMGVVWAASHTLTGREVALKFLKARVVTPKARRRFLREARAASAVRHPGVVEIHDVFDLEDGSPVMVMELLSGISLAARLERELRLPLAEAAAILLPVISAVGAAHALGIVHRDLKPENIFLVGGSSQQIKVLDFGIAKLTGLRGPLARSTGLTQSGALLGTPCYMAPEQAFGEREIDHRADVWALGLLLYQCLAGVLPTRAENIGQVLKIIVTGAIPPLEEIAPDLPRELTGLVNRMLSRDREGRPADLREVAAVLARCAGAPCPVFGAPSIPPPGAPEPAPAQDARPGAQGGSGVDPLASTAAVLTRVDAGAGARPRTSEAPRQASSAGWSVWSFALLAGLAGLMVGGMAVRSLRDEPPSALPASSFALTLESIPPGATVLSGGRTLGATPFRISIRNAEAEAAPLWLTLQKPGYEPYTVEQGPSGEARHVVVHLAPASGSLGGPTP